MMTTSTIYEPTNSGSLFVAAIFGDNGLLVASYSFPTRAGAEVFVAACTAGVSNETATGALTATLPSLSVQGIKYKA
jgi:hypothetical protein